MNNLPYFLSLLKNDDILWMIIKNESFTGIDLKNIEHVFWTSQYLKIINYSLNEEEKFIEIWITLTDIATAVSFRTNSPKYLENTRYYFDDDTIMYDNSSFHISDTRVSSPNKDLDTIDVGLEMPLHVKVGSSNVYGYYIDITIYKKDWHKKVNEII